MDFSISPRQRELVTEVTAFARRTLTERAADNDAHARFDRVAWNACAEQGVFGWPVGTRWGGSDLDPVSCALAFEALGYGCRDNGVMFAINNHVWACISYLLTHGTQSQKDRYLPGLVDGSTIGAHALTEPQAGSDVLALSATAVRDGDGYLLNGVKTFISNAPCADLFVVFVRGCDTRAPQQSLSAFLLPADTPGVTVDREWDKAGLRATPMGELHLRDVRLDGDALLGTEGGGYSIFTSTIEWERGFMFAGSVGAMRRVMEDTVRFANERRQFGAPIGANQAISHKLADMRVRVELGRALLYRFAWLKSQNRLALLESSMLKLYVSEGLVQTTMDAMQINGARGYLTEFGVERELRDALGTTIYGGTSEIHRSIIARLTGVAEGP